MKTTFIVGSPRSNGSSSIIADKIIEGMNSNNKYYGEIKKYCLGDTELKYCVGCKTCYETGKYALDDGFQNVLSRHTTTPEGISIGSPFYGE